MCPMPGDDVTPSVIPTLRPSHHSGPGYVAKPKAADFEMDEPLRAAAARWLNLVPAGKPHVAPGIGEGCSRSRCENTRAAAPVIRLRPCGRPGSSPPEGSRRRRSGSRRSCSPRRRCGGLGILRMHGRPPRRRPTPIRHLPRRFGALRSRCTGRAGSRRRANASIKLLNFGQPVRSCVDATRPGQGLARSGQP